jgi:hypothetical protein
VTLAGLRGRADPRFDFFHFSHRWISVRKSLVTTATFIYNPSDPFTNVVAKFNCNTSEAHSSVDFRGRHQIASRVLENTCPPIKTVWKQVRSCVAIEVCIHPNINSNFDFSSLHSPFFHAGHISLRHSIIRPLVTPSQGSNAFIV